MPQTNIFTIFRGEILTDILVEPAALEGVRRICGQVRDDLALVTGRECAVCGSLAESTGASAVLAATIGESPLLDDLTGRGLVCLDDTVGKREVYLTQVLERPFPEKPELEKVLLIAGSDKRGTIYGLLHLSEQCGVSPLIYWGDVTPLRQEKVVLELPVRQVSKEPSIRYRGFFINDEWPAFGSWCTEKFGGVNAAAYEQIFLLLLRLKGNYLWPAMWRGVFSEDGPGLECARLADMYGVIMGTSHHEPLCRAGEEWSRVWQNYGTNPDWSFLTNSRAITAFWKDGLLRNRPFENVITIGMRGEADSKLLSEDASMADNVGVLKKAILTQHSLLREHLNSDLTKVPRMLAIYKEVEDYYCGDETCPGLREWEELDDVIFLLSDDNFGNLRTLPDPAGPSHPGGYGMYYHFDYHGGPISCEWLNGNPLAKIWEQMSAAYDHGVKEMWIVNAGDLKGTEFALSYFLELAYDFDAWGSTAPNRTREFTARWMDRQFSCTEAGTREKLIELQEGWSRLNVLRRPEALTPEVYHPIHYREGERVWQKAEALTELAEALGREIPEQRQAAYWEMIGYPALLTANLVQLHIEAGWNHMLAQRGSIAANGYGQKVKARIQRDREYVNGFHSLAGGKWNHMLDSAHMDFRTWDDNGWRYPVIHEVIPVPEARVVVSVRGKDAFHLGCHWQDQGPLVCDAFLRPDACTAVLDIDSRGDRDFTYRIICNRDWLICSPAEGRVSVSHGGRASVELTCRRELLKGRDAAEAAVEINFTDGNHTRSLIEVQAEGQTEAVPAGTFLERHGCIAMDACHYSEKEDTEDGGFQVIQGLGRTGSAVKAYPTVKDWSEAASAPSLRYTFFASSEGPYKLELHTAPRNPTKRGRRMTCRISVNGGQCQTVPTVSSSYRAGDQNKEWGKGVLENNRAAVCQVQVREGLNDLLIYAGEPGVVLERIILYPAGHILPESYLGPAESFRVSCEPLSD